MRIIGGERKWDRGTREGGRRRGGRGNKGTNAKSILPKNINNTHRHTHSLTPASFQTHGAVSASVLTPATPSSLFSANLQECVRSSHTQPHISCCIWMHVRELTLVKYCYGVFVRVGLSMPWLVGTWNLSLQSNDSYRLHQIAYKHPVWQTAYDFLLLSSWVRSEFNNLQVGTFTKCLKKKTNSPQVPLVSELSTTSHGLHQQLYLAQLSCNFLLLWAL